jgi:CDP-diacylglycerol--glycerol-3-phosphate 3-phosphatidyltransferase
VAKAISRASSDGAFSLSRSGVIIAAKRARSKVNLSRVRSAIASRLTEPVAGVLARTGLSPNTLSWIGFVLALGAAAFIISGHLLAAGFVLLAAGFFDILDGALARRIKKVTPFGGVLDSVLDRLSEAAVLLAILVLYAQEAAFIPIILVCLALIGSLLVSYVRARAEGAGLECRVGIFTRGERVVVLALGLLLSQFDYVLVIALAIIVVFSFFTFIQRLIYVWQQTKK